MNVVYHLIVAYLAGHFVWYIFREKSFPKQAGAALVLILLLLRLFLIH